MCIAVILLWKLADLNKNAAFVGEYGLIETAQTAILLLASFSLGIQACGNRIYRPLLLLLGSLTLKREVLQLKTWQTQFRLSQTFTTENLHYFKKHLPEW